MDFVWKLRFSKQMSEILASAKSKKLGLLKFSCDRVQNNITNIVGLLTELIVGRQTLEDTIVTLKCETSPRMRWPPSAEMS